MDDMDEVYKKIQMFLMKKDQEYGELRYLTSRTTDKSIRHIEEICQSMSEISRAYDIPVKRDKMVANKKCVQLYKYLVLNTNFKNQERLAEDIINGYMVDMCPPLSPYLLLQILWNLEYEEVLVESFLYLPFDLCTEILDVVKKCTEELPFERSIEIVYRLIWNVYTKFKQVKEIGLQTMNAPESIQSLLAKFQELTLLLTNPKVTRVMELSSLQKYERHGIMLKRLIRTIKNCLEPGTIEGTVSKDLAKIYKITFGSEPYVKCEDTLMEETILSLNQELMTLLLNKIKEIDCNIYLGWAELKDEENVMISLQRSIGNDCYYFIEFMQNDEVLSQDIHLMECLQQLSSKPDTSQSGFVLNLQELCHAISEGKKEHTKELMYRYKEWDRSILDFIHENRSIFTKDDCLQLLKYLTFILKNSDDEEMKHFTYTLVTEILSLQSIPDIYEIVMEYVTMYNGKNHLESQHTEETFNDFITRNSNLRTPKNLCIILLFLLKNPQMVLTVLLKITVGHPKYRNIMISANDILLLSPFLCIRVENNHILLTSILKTICTENEEWNTKKFMNLICIMLEKSVVKVDDLMNNVFIPYLETNTLNVSNMNSILNNIYKLQTKCTGNTNVKGLMIALAKRMSSLRKDTSLLKYVSSEIFAQMTRILEYFLDIRSKKIPTNVKNEIIDGIETVIEPIEKLHFASLWQSQEAISILYILQDYERYCFSVVNRLKQDKKTPERIRDYLMDLSLLREDFLRHLLIRSTEEEYQRFGMEYCVMYWFIFGSNDEIETCHNFLRLTIEACCLSLEYPSVGAKDLFIFLLKCFTKFCKVFVRLRGMEWLEEMNKSLIQNNNTLQESIKHSPYADLYTTLLVRLNNDVQHDPESSFLAIINALELFTQECFELGHERPEEAPVLSHSPKVTNFYVTHKIISACMKVPAAEAYECIRRMNELFSKE